MFGHSSQLPTTAEHCFVVWTVLSDLITPHSAVIESFEEPPNIWLTVAKNTFVGWALNFRVRMLLKGTVRHQDLLWGLALIPYIHLTVGQCRLSNSRLISCNKCHWATLQGKKVTRVVNTECGNYETLKALSKHDFQSLKGRTCSTFNTKPDIFASQRNNRLFFDFCLVTASSWFAWK